MSGHDDFLAAATARLAVVIEEEERLLLVIRKEQTKSVRVDAATPSSLPTAIELRVWGQN
jgi:hypothetical protein